MKKISILLAFVFVLVGFRYFYYGSLTRSCIYTEKQVSISSPLLASRVYFIKNAAILRGADLEYHCLNEMGAITNQIVEAQSVQHYPGHKSEIVGAESKLELSPVKLIEVTKHGFTTMDSGSGPIRHLILRDQSGVLYQVATVSLGINAGDEYLKAVGPSGERVLNFSTKWTD